jgi:hypothetical protein
MPEDWKALSMFRRNELLPTSGWKSENEFFHSEGPRIHPSPYSPWFTQDTYPSRSYLYIRTMFGLFFYRENGSSKFPENIGNDPLGFMASCTRTQ